MPPKSQRATKKRRMNITRQIERWPRIKVVENKWIRHRVGSKLEDITIRRASELVTSREAGNLPPHKFAIHTHTKAGSIRGALPSKLDLINHASSFPKHDFRNSTVIASINKKGKVMGYTFIKTRKFVPEVKTDNSAISDLWHRMTAEEKASAEAVLAVYRKAFYEFGMNLKIRFFPLPGYRYDPKTGRFAPKPK